MNTINRKSWHYWVWKKCGGTESDGWGNYHHISLCGYVQRIFWMCLLRLIVASFVASFLVAVLYHLFLATIHHPVFIASVIGGGIVITAILVWLVNRDWASYEEKELGIFGQWVKAKKEKVCPLLTFETKD